MWCRHQDCGRAYETEKEQVPSICPSCRRMGSWTIVAPSARWELSYDDKRFLKSIRIDPEDAPTMSEDDEA